MEKYVVSARKYRPSSFKTIVGQHALAATLKNAVKTGRLAHSYLFCGQRGVGKTTTARIFAKAINCEHLTEDGEPCNECESCRAFNEQRSLNIIEMDAASNNSVDDIREITAQVLVPPITGKYRVFIIDEVHMLSPAAFNAFLKTLEEPPEYVIFILATTEKNKILPTILSRCQKYDFQSITASDIADQLQYVADCEGYMAERAGLNIIAQKSDGAMRDALSIFDQVAASSNGHITYQAVIDNLNVLDYDYYFKLVDAFLKGDVESSLLIYKDVRTHGFEGKTFINGLAVHLRELMMAHSPSLAPMLEVADEIADKFRQQSANCSMQFFFKALDLCNTCDLTYRDATNKQLLVELTLIKICQLSSPDSQPSPTQGNGLKKIERSESSQVQQVASAPAPSKSTSPTPSDASISYALSQAIKSDVRPVNIAQPKSVVQEKKPISIPSLTSLKNAAGSQGKAEASAVLHKRSEKYFYEDFKMAWNSFIGANPKEVILLSAMKTSMPENIKGEDYIFTVDNQAQLEAFEKKQQDLLTFMRNRLENDMITISAKVRDVTADEKIWSQRDLLIDVIKRHPEGLDFIKQFKLSLL